MSNLLTKFEDHLEVIYDAIEGVSDLRDDRKLYKKLHKFYKSEGVIFTGDTNHDYNLVLTYIQEDLYINGLS